MKAPTGTQYLLDDQLEQGMWEIGETVHIGWPDFGRPPQLYEVVEVDRSGPVVRVRVRDHPGNQGGFLVVYGCPDSMLEKLATAATGFLGFPVTVPPLRCSMNGAILRSFDYEWWPTPEYAERPRLIVETIANLLDAMKKRVNIG